MIANFVHRALPRCFENRRELAILASVRPGWTKRHAALDEAIWTETRRRLVERSPVPSTVYHYTTLSAAISILQNRCLWLTHQDHFEDELETRHVHNVVLDTCAELLLRHRDTPVERVLARFVDAYPEVMSRQSPIFIASCSDRPTVEHLWQKYAGDYSGVCIGFPAKVVDEHDDPRLPTLGFPVTYSADDERAWLQGLFTWLLQHKPWDNLASELILQHMAMTAAFVSFGFKHPRFAVEEEWRLIGWPHASSGVPVIESPKPHVEWQIDYGKSLSLQSIHVGCRADDGIERVRSVLASLRYGESGEPLMPEVIEYPSR